MPKKTRVTQRGYMRELVRKFGQDQERVASEYARAEERGEVPRLSNQHGIPSFEYAWGLYNDGKRKGWL